MGVHYVRGDTMSGDLYERPSRAEIAARVNGAAPAKPSPEPQPPALTAFSKYLRARMRALGWTQEDLQGRAGLSAHIAARAINGPSCDLGTAEQLARLAGLPLAVMLGPYTCSTCAGHPPAGFSCLECGTGGERLSGRARLEAAAAEAAGRGAR